MKTRLKKIATAALVLFVLQWGAVAWARAAVSRSLGRGALEMSRQLHDAATLLSQMQVKRDGARLGEPQVMRVNGARVRLQVGTIRFESRAQLRQMMDRVKSSCQPPESGGHAESPLLEVPVLEWSTGHEALVHCLEPRRSWTKEALLAAFSNYAESGDLTEWGSYQGAHFRVDGEWVSILTTEVLGGLVPTEMFPLEGDSPGANVASIPAPPGRRLLSVTHDDRVALTVHRTSGNVIAALDEYRERLAEAGVRVERPDSAKGAARALVALTEDDAFVVVAHRVDGLDEGSGQLSVARLPR